MKEDIKTSLLEWDEDEEEWIDILPDDETAWEQASMVGWED